MPSFHGIGLFPKRDAVEGNINFFTFASVANFSNPTVISILSLVVSIGFFIEFGILVT